MEGPAPRPSNTSRNNRAPREAEAEDNKHSGVDVEDSSKLGVAVLQLRDSASLFLSVLTVVRQITTRVFVLKTPRTKMLGDHGRVEAAVVVEDTKAAVVEDVWVLF